MWRAAGKCFARSHRRTLRATAGAASSSSCGVAAAGGKSLDTPPASVFATPLSRQPAVKDARAFFAVRCMSSAAHDGSHGGWAVKMPQITEDESFGKLTVWLKKEGEAVSPGDQLCEVECTDFGFSLSAEESGWIAQILVPEGGDKVPVGSPLCVLVDRQQDIPLYLADHEAKAAAGQFSFSTKDLMLAIGRILRKNKVNHDVGLKLLSLARRDNLALYEAFDASFEGDSYSQELVDEDAFLRRAADIVTANFPPLTSTTTTTTTTTTSIGKE